MKVVILNKSDATGGAAVVSRRLMDALRAQGVDAHMLVCEKITSSPFVVPAAKPGIIKRKFLLERIKIFLANGLNRSTLFKIDTGSEGLPLWKHPLVKEADAILVNWVNQGMLSLSGLRKLLALKKPVICTMHDMWDFTGICHHAGICTHFMKECGDCPLLGKLKAPNDLSNKVWKKKNKIFGNSVLTSRLAFVPVSNWLKDKALQSSLIKDKRIEVIPNPFPLLPDSYVTFKSYPKSQPIRILFGAARLDDPIKGLHTLRLTSELIKKNYPELASRLEIALFGNVKNSGALEGFSLPLIHLGVLKGEQEVRKAYLDSRILVSASSYETLPGTLVEAQAYGAIPVSFNRGGQSDIIDQLSTGYIADYNPDINIRARNLANGILWACSIVDRPDKLYTMQKKMRENVENRFSYYSIAQKYISLILSL